MGGSGSKPQDEKPFCVDCQKEKQRDLPADDGISSHGQPCAELYARVAVCMEKNNGQIVPCKSEWEAFQKCHNQNRPRR